MQSNTTFQAALGEEQGATVVLALEKAPTKRTILMLTSVQPLLGCIHGFIAQPRAGDWENQQAAVSTWSARASTGRAAHMSTPVRNELFSSFSPQSF